MTLEEFQKNLELINQIETIKAQKNNYVSRPNINNYENIQKNNVAAPYSNEYINKTKNQSQNIFQKAGKWFGNMFQSAKNWEDGYDFGDVTKTVIGSAADAGLNAYNAVASMMEGISKVGALGIAQVADWTGNDKFADAMRKEISNPNSDAYLTPKVNAFREKYVEPNSIFGTSADQVASGVGSTIGGAALSVLGGANIGKLHDIPVGMGIAEMGNSVAENYSKEDVTDAQAWLNGAGKGLVSALYESIFGAFGVGGSELDDVLVKKVTKNMNSQLAKGIAQLGIKAGGEATEEFLEYAGGYLTNLATDMISQGKGAEFYEKWDSDEVLQNMLSAFISTGITQSGGTMSNLINGRDVITGNTKQVQSQIDQEVQSQVQALQEKGEKVSTAKQLELERNATEKIYLNNAKQELVDIVNNSENIDNTLKKGIVSNIESSKDFKSLNLLSNMIENYDKGNSKLAPAGNNSINVPTQKNMAKQTFLDSAKSNNIDVENNTEVLDSMFEMAYQRGVNISIDGKVFNNENQDALWRVNKETGQREIIVNPNNPTKALQSITIHEMTHDMENTEAYNQLSKVVLDYAKKQNNYDNAFKELSDMYAEEYKQYKGEEYNSRIEQEMVADILGEKLGNQEFVNNLVTSNRGVAQNIYSWIVDKLNKVNKLTGYKFEKLYWADVKSKFDRAFNSEFNNLEGEIKYSVKNDANGNKYIEIEEDILKGVPKNDWIPTIKELFKTKFPNGIDMGFFNIGLNAKSVREFLNSKYTQEIKSNQKDTYKAKLKMANNLDEIVQNASNVKNETARHKNYKSYNRGYIGVKIGNDFYNIEVLTGINSKNGEMFYDIVNIKKGLLSSSLTTENDSNPITNIISQNQENINDDIKNNISTKDNKGRQLSTQQQEYFKDSKVRDENGELKTYYHGTQRADRVGNIFDPAKATSGPMAFFTDNEEIAKSYSENKQDTSISREVDTEYDLFKVDGKSLDDYWNSLTREQKNKIAQEGYNIGFDNDYENIVHEENASKNSFSNQYDYYLNYEEKGNAIKALYDVFIQDGNLMFEDMEKFQDVLKYAGIDNVTYLDQYKIDSKVYEVYLNITNPFDTSEVTQDNIKELKRLAMKAPVSQAYNADQWDKTNITPSNWINRLEEDYKNGTSHAWTSIPDFVTNYLKSKGYDGIVDTGGKNGGAEHQVVIPFYSNQIKNVDNVNPTSNDDIRYSKSSNNDYQKFLKDNFSNDGTKTYMKDIKLPSKISNLKNELRDIVNESNNMDKGMKDSVLKVINDTDTESKLQSYKEDLKPQIAPVKSGTIKITNYKNAKLNSKIVNNALSVVEANRQGKRTKSQWLQVAEQIGMNIKENEIDKYAYKTWSDFLPNQKSNLNRQGEKYVPFTKNEWIKAVEDGYYKANVKVEGITKEESQSIEKVIEDKDITNKSSEELWNELVNNSSEEAQELLDGRNIEIKQGRKNTKAVSNDKSIEISKSGNIYLNNSKPTAEQFRNGLENHFEKGEKRLIPINNKQVQEGYNVEEWNGNEWEKSDSNSSKSNNNISLLDEESSTLKYLKDSRNNDKASFNEIADSLMQKFVNRGHYVDKLAKQANNQELKFAYDKTLSTFAEAQYSIGIAQTDSKGNEIGKSLIDIFKPVKDAGLSNEFNDYLLNRLNIERQAVEKSVFGPEITSETSRNNIRKYEKQYPQFKEWAEDVYKYNNNELQNLVDAGFISEDTQELFHSMYGDYVPIHRILEETVDKASKTTKETGATSPIKRAKGGFQEILDIETAMAENVLSSKKAIRMNELGIELAKSTGNTSILEEIGYQPKWTPDAIVSLNGDVILNEDGKYLYTVYTNGEMKQFQISKELFEGLRKDTLDSKIRNNKVLNTLLTPIEKLTKAQRDLLTTYSVGFALNNPIKDFQDGIFYTKYGVGTFLRNYTVALQEIATKGEYYKKYMALGGMDNSYFDYGSGIKTEAKGVKKLFNKIKKINGILETAPRLAEYISSIQNGATQNEAMYNAADITTNFKRGGEITKVANKYGANFLNASVQGLDKFVRTFTNLNVKSGLKLITRVASMGILPTLLNSLLYKDDDDYEKLEDYIKDEYYLIKISDDGDFIRIPKGRVLATISSATRTILDGVKEGEFDLKSFKDEAIKQLAPNNPLEDNLLAPVMQVAKNKTWYGTDLVPTRLQNQLPKNQYNEKTDKISLWLGENLNISPIKINYLIDQYSGGIGDVILPMLTPQAENNIITDKFTTSSISKNKTVGEFYDALDKYEKLKNDSNASEEEKTKYSYLSKISSKVGELYGKKREIQMDSSLTDKEKKELVKEIQKEINAYTECAMDNINGEYTTENKWNMYVDGIISDTVRENDGNSALQDALYIINNGIATKEEYMNMYQLSKDNGTSIPTMNTLVELKENNVKLTSYTDFKIGTKDYKADKDENDKTISGSLNSKKATYIMDMNISKEQKNGLLNVLSEGSSYDDLNKLNGNYGTYFQQSGKTPTTGGLSAREKYMSLINSGISVDELNIFYEQIGNISAIKDENGKTISGSKKQLIFNFINSLKLSVPQKMILLAKQYSSFGKKYIKEILQYISTSNMKKQEKIKLIYMLYKN